MTAQADNQQALERARQWLAQSRAPVSFSGAGLSAESGVPTFRDSQASALWSRYDPMQLASPEGFAEDPELVIDWYHWRRQKLAEAEPNAAHRALAAQPGMPHITQNVDDLLERAGADAANVHHLHGRIGEDICHSPRCGHREPVDLAAPPALRACPACGAHMRPAVVWFGEALPGQIWAEAERAVRNADLMLAVGTSATVYPAAGLIELAKRVGARVVLVNTEASGASGLADLALVGTAGDWLAPLLNG